MASEPSRTLVERVHDFVSEHKQAVLIGTAALVITVGGVAYYASTSRPPDDGDVEKNARKGKEKKKGTKTPKKRKSVKVEDGPILEERTKVSEEEFEEVRFTKAQIDAMSTEERARTAAYLKTKGNTAYQQRKFQLAVRLYTQAIEVSPKEEAVFYSNRAACYVNMSPPQYDLVVSDCDEALRLDSRYLKALNRRAAALEHLERYEEALRDFTAATILDKFQNTATAQSVERVLKKLSSGKASLMFSEREPRLPSFMFISAYFAAFRPRSPPELPSEPSTGDSTLMLALDALKAADYIHALSLVNEALDQQISWDVGRAEALNLRGTFKFLVGDVTGSEADLLASIALVPSSAQSLVKLASVYMELGNPEQAFECFKKAIDQDPTDPDIYYHRGQVHFIMSQFAEAAEDYTKSTALDNQFVFSHVQLAVAQYKQGNLANSMATFRRTLRAFPKRSEPQNYYGELLLDQQQFSEAVEKFDRAIELERNKPPPMNVLPLVNKGLALYQWKQDAEAAEACCQEALQIDPECDAAVATIAQLCLQQGQLGRAVEMFAKQAELARTELELTNALTYQYATRAQQEFLKNYPDMAAQLSQIARGMMT